MALNYVSAAVPYLCRTPTPPLTEFIDQFWYSCDARAPQRVQIVPTGTIELVFNLDQNDLGFYFTEQFASYKSFSGAVFSGPHARPLFVETRKHVMGVHFKPGGAFPFLRVPASELTDNHVDLEALWGKSAQDLREQLCAVSTPGKRFQVLESALVACLENSLEEHRAVRAALDIFRRDSGEARIRNLAAHLGLSQRHFIKNFSKQVGITPKVFSRVQRFQRAVDLTRRKSPPNWADIAAACGYFDQSHLIHDFQNFVGLNPTEFLRQRSARLVMNPPISE